jgi:hypothetical protein
VADALRRAFPTSAPPHHQGLHTHAARESAAAWARARASVRVEPTPGTSGGIRLQHWPSAAAAMAHSAREYEPFRARRSVLFRGAKVAGSYFPRRAANGCASPALPQPRPLRQSAFARRLTFAAGCITRKVDANNACDPSHVRLRPQTFLLQLRPCKCPAQD